VVDPGEEPVPGSRAPHRTEARQERAGVVLALDEGVQGLAVGGDRRQADRAVLVGELVRLGDPAGPAADGDAVGVLGAGNAQRHHLDAVAVLGDVPRHLAAAVQRRGEDEANGALLDDPGGAVAHARLQPRVGSGREAERVLEEVRRGERVADIKLDVVDAEQRHLVVGGNGGRGAFGALHGLGCHTHSPCLRRGGFLFMIRRRQALFKHDSLRINGN
jgi:hypothetical protein